MAKLDNAFWIPFRSKLAMVRLVLCVVWDPIGVFGHRNTLDEYDSYAERILQLAERTRDADEISEELRRLESGHIGLRTVDETARRLAVERILQVVASFEG